MELNELIAIISAAGGGTNAVAYAHALLPKLKRIKNLPHGEKLLKQLKNARNAGDFRGRLLEVNFADLFLQSGHTLEYGAKQGRSGDIDFCWTANSRRIFFELKLLGESQSKDKTMAGENAANAKNGNYLERLDTNDIVRLQRDLMSKSSTRKFNSVPEADWINLVVIDVSELQIGTVDAGDCLLAAGGNPLVSRHFDETFTREDVVGVFEKPTSERAFSSAQLKWIEDVIRPPVGSPHPRDYIHGALFLFRVPAEKAALSYDLSAVLVWNTARISKDVGGEVCSAIHEVVPHVSH